MQNRNLIIGIIVVIVLVILAFAMFRPSGAPEQAAAPAPATGEQSGTATTGTATTGTATTGN